MHTTITDSILASSFTNPMPLLICDELSVLLYFANITIAPITAIILIRPVPILLKPLPKRPPITNMTPAITPIDLSISSLPSRPFFMFV